jgi:hypothetical protein
MPHATWCNLATLLRDALAAKSALERPFEVWFQDEARVGQQGTLTRVWGPVADRAKHANGFRCGFQGIGE